MNKNDLLKNKLFNMIKIIGHNRIIRLYTTYSIPTSKLHLQVVYGKVIFERLKLPKGINIDYQDKKEMAVKCHLTWRK